MDAEPCHRPGGNTEPCGVPNVVNHLGTPDFSVLHRLSQEAVPVSGHRIFVWLAHAVYSVRQVYPAESQRTRSFVMFHREGVAQQVDIVMRSSRATASKFVRPGLGSLPNGLGILFQRLSHRRCRPALRQQPTVVPPLVLPRRARRRGLETIADPQETRAGSWLRRTHRQRQWLAISAAVHRERRRLCWAAVPSLVRLLTAVVRQGEATPGVTVPTLGRECDQFAERRIPA